MLSVLSCPYELVFSANFGESIDMLLSVYIVAVFCLSIACVTPNAIASKVFTIANVCVRVYVCRRFIKHTVYKLHIIKVCIFVIVA